MYLQKKPSNKPAFCNLSMLRLKIKTKQTIYQKITLMSYTCMFERKYFNYLHTMFLTILKINCYPAVFLLDIKIKGRLKDFVSSTKYCSDKIFEYILTIKRNSKIR